jgi:hypothetical protein
MRKSNRVLFKPKVYGFNPWADQVPAIKQIMEETGQESEAPVLRMLIDEALRARRRKTAGKELPEQQPPSQELPACLQTIQLLLLKMVGQGETAFRVHSLSLELLQETLAEARAGRLDLGASLALSVQTQDGICARGESSLFDERTAAGKEFAYGLAEEIRAELFASENEGLTATSDDGDRQRRLIYDDSETSSDNGNF